MKAYLAPQDDWLVVERLPGYAPDLNPAETLWGNIKGQELANRCAPDLGEVHQAVKRGMARVRRSFEIYGRHRRILPLLKLSFSRSRTKPRKGLESYKIERWLGAPRCSGRD